MKKLKRVFGSVANLTAGRGDDQGSPDPPIPLSSSRKSVSGSTSGLSDHRGGSYVSYESQSLDSYNSTISAEVDPYSKHDKSFTKLHKWAYIGDVNKLKKFIKKVPVDAQDGEGKTALHHAAAQGRGDALLYLLGSKGNVEMKDNAGMTPFLRAVERSQLPIVQMLLQRRVDVQIKDQQGNSSSHIAAKTGAVELLTLLLDCGGDCDAPNSLGRTPLHLACSENQQDIVEALLRHGSDVNVTDKESVTPLMMAAKVGSAPLVETLLETGADVTPIDASKWSAADYARFTNHNQLHHRLSSLMEKSGSSGLFSNDLLNVSDEGSSQEEGAVGFDPKGKTSDIEGAVDSWSDASEVNSIKEKPKLNLTKFLPSSDESADNAASAVPEPALSLTGPPKPPRLYTSSSSLASATADEKDENIHSEKNESLIKGEEEEESLKADDSWKSSSDDEPKLKAFSVLPVRKDSDHTLGESKSRRESLDKSIGAESQSRLKKGDLLAELGLDNIDYHSSDEEDVSFDEEDTMLPIEGGTTGPVTINRRKSQAVLDVSDFRKSSLPKESHDQLDSNVLTSPMHSSKSSARSERGLKLDNMGQFSPSSSEGNKKRTPLNLSPKKSPSRRSPKKSASKGRKPSSSIFDSDTEEEVVSPQRPIRRKSSTPTKKRTERSPPVEYDISDEEDYKDRSLIQPQSPKVTSVDYRSKEDLPSPLQKIPQGDKDKMKTNDLVGKLSDSSGTNTSGSRLSLFAGSNGKSRTSTLSTVVGTLGREGTMQEVEEMWEANPSISHKRSSSSSSVQNSEEHSKSMHEELLGPSSGLVTKEQKEAISDCNSETKRNSLSVKESKEKSKSEKENIISKDTSSLSDNEIDTHLPDDNSQTALALSSSKPLASLETKETKRKASSEISRKKSVSPEGSLSPKSMKDQNVVKEKLENNGADKHDVGNKTSSKTMDSDKAKGHSVIGKSLSKGSRTGTGRTSGIGSIVFSDEDSISQDPLTTPRLGEEIDDVISAASTETEESTHFNSGLKDSLLTPLSSLPDAADVGQLQDLVRELRLKLEKEFGRRAAIETRYSHLLQKQKHVRLQNDQLETDAQRLLQEISTLSSRIKQLEYLGQCDQDSSRLKEQSLDDFHERCEQLEEQCCTLRTHALKQEQLVDSLMVQLQTKERVNQSLQMRLEEISSQTKYVSMKSCQTEEVFTSVQTEDIRGVDVSVQTLDDFPVKIATDLSTDDNIPESEVKGSEQECSNCCKLREQMLCETNVASVQTEPEIEIKEDQSTYVSVGTQIEKSCNQTSSTGIQCVPERVMKTCQTQNSTQSHQSQTDMTSINCEVTQRKIVSDSSCQASFVGRVAAVQTDTVVPADEQSPDRRDIQTLNASEVTSALEPVLQNFSQDFKSLIVEAIEANQNSIQGLMTKSITDQIQDLKGSMEDSLQQKSIQQNQETELKFSDWTRHLEEILQSQADTVTEVCNSTAATKNADIHELIMQVNNSLQSKFESMGQEIGNLQKTQGGNEEKITSHVENVIKDMKDSNDKVLKCLADFRRENSDANIESYDKYSQLTLSHFDDLQKVIQTLNHFEDSGISENGTKGIVNRLDSLEKSLMLSFEKSNASQDFSSIEGELHKINDGIHKKLSVLQTSVQTVGSAGKIDQDILDSYTVILKESNKQLLHVLRTKTSESTTNINEALEENFHILQDHLRRVQQSLVQRINEVFQHVNVAEDQKMSWISKHVTEMANQVSGMQTNLLRMQSSLEATQSLPPAGGMLDEALISSLRVSNEQAVTSLKFQNQSMIQLLESLQKEIHNSAQKPQTSKDMTEIYHLKETLTDKEEELVRLHGLQESLHEKLRVQILNLDRCQRREEEQRQKIDSLLEKVHHLEGDLKERAEKLTQEKLKTNNQSEDSAKIRQENFRLSSENAKLSSLLNAEQQQRQWYESELQSQRDAREMAETKVQEVIMQLQISRQQMPLQRTPPTGRDNDDDSIMLKQREINRLESEKKEVENHCNEQHNQVQRLELRLKETEADVGLERSMKEDLEKQLKKTKDTVEKLQKKISEATFEHGILEDLENSKAELEAALKSNEVALDTFRRKIETLNKEKLQLKQDIMILNGEKLSFELIKQERDLAEEMQKKMEAQLQLLQRKISEDYIPKSRLNHMMKEVEHKYQLELSAKLSELSHLMAEQNQHQESHVKTKEYREQGMKREIDRLSEEVIRLQALLSVHEEKKDSWKVRHDRLMNLYQQQAQSQHSMHKSSYSRKSPEDPLSINLREINAHLQTPLATSTLLGQLTPPSAMQPPKTPSNIDSYHYTHSDSLDRTLQKYLRAAENSHSRYLSSSDDKPHARISPMQLSHLHDTLPTLDRSCEAYVDMLNKKYGL